MKSQWTSRMLFGATLVLAALGAVAKSHPVKSIYDRVGGIHKIAAAVSESIEVISKDEILTENARFKLALSQTNRSLMNFSITSYVANLLGGPQVPTVDLAALHKFLEFDQKQENRLWDLQWPIFQKNGFSEADFKSTRKMFEMKMKMAKPMAPPTMEMFKDKSTLYARLGGLAPISIVVNDFVDMLATDPIITGNKQVVNSIVTGKITPAGLKYLVTEQLVMASGGPMKYTGRTMADSHKGLMVTEKEWESGAMILKKVLDKYHVPEKEQGEIFQVISSTHNDIVGK